MASDRPAQHARSNMNQTKLFCFIFAAFISVQLNETLSLTMLALAFMCVLIFLADVSLLQFFPKFVSHWMGCFVKQLLFHISGGTERLSYVRASSQHWWQGSLHWFHWARYLSSSTRTRLPAPSFHQRYDLSCLLVSTFKYIFWFLYLRVQFLKMQVFIWSFYLAFIPLINVVI